MAKKDRRLIWIVYIVIGLILLYDFYPDLFYIFTPKAPAEISDYINKYYFPVNTKAINSDRCTVPDVTIGASFPWDIAKLPIGTDYMLVDGQYYKVSRSGATAKGDCTKVEGSQFLVNGQAPLKNFLLIKKGTSYLVCQNLDGGRYKYSQFNPVTGRTNRYYIKYSIPQIEPEGKYYCDSRAGTIYRTPCGGKPKEIIEKCELGCEVSIVNIDKDAQVQAVKCKGEYQPNKVVCSSDGKKLFIVDSQGILKTDTCCSCYSGKCSKTVGCTPRPKSCKLLKGDGTNQVNVFIVEDKNYANYTQWIIDNFPTYVPYNEYTFNFYSEQYKYDCRGTVKESVKDIRIAYDSACPSVYACAMLSNDINVAGYLSYTAPKFVAITKQFLVLHEAGHDYLHYSHTCDGSIMDADGGRSNRYAYPPYQVVVIRKNLNSSNKIYYLPRGNYSCGYS